MLQSAMLKVIIFFLIQGTLQVQASGLFCSDLFQEENHTFYSVTETDIINALKKIDQTLIKKLKKSQNPFAEYDFAEPYNAFFLSDSDPENATPWKSLVKELKLSRVQLDSSWNSPLYLSPLEISLYRGHLFPSAYFVRRTGLNGLNRAIPTDFPSFGEKLPYALVRGSSVEVHEIGGSKKLFELWLLGHQSVSRDSYATLYRACSRSEYQLQVFIRDLATEDLNFPVSVKQLQELEKISSAMIDYEYKSELDRIIKNVRDQGQTKKQLQSILTESIAFMSGGVFTSFDKAGAKGFQRENDVIVSYRVPLDQLQTLIINNEAYFGIEFNYFELAFINEPVHQNAKKILFNSIFDVEY